MTANNQALASAIREAVENLRNGPDTEANRQKARNSIEGVLVGTELEKQRITEKLIPRPISKVVSAVNSESVGGSGETELPPIEYDDLEDIAGRIERSPHSLAEISDDWDLRHN
ncbi:hypothetical protein [Pseudomonas sp. ICMP 460]|uniref:hypothetical protein n=1 Tax=Pseudomonas sp. ICMP 460 TaxID=1718917 RepID=UPI000C06A8DC|nr:hypothetical protein [Pseudomonas sp. ICMP 460]PHN32150.1 hypothetical protein AO240_09075 [Pseudomonas sp. ICMP 460]